MARKRFKPTSFEDKPVSELISAPIISIAKANEAFAWEQVRYILNRCYSYDEGSDQFSPVMIRMAIYRGVIDSEQSDNGESYMNLKQVKATFEVPLITLLPVSALAIDDCKLDFSLDITTHTSALGKNAAQVMPHKEYRVAPDVAAAREPLRAKIGKSSPVAFRRADDQNQQKEVVRSGSSTSIDMSLKVKSVPIPKGLSSIIDFYSKNIDAVSVEESQ